MAQVRGKRAMVLPTYSRRIDKDVGLAGFRDGVGAVFNLVDLAKETGHSLKKGMENAKLCGLIEVRFLVCVFLVHIIVLL